MTPYESASDYVAKNRQHCIDLVNHHGIDGAAEHLGQNELTGLSTWRSIAQALIDELELFEEDY